VAIFGQNTARQRLKRATQAALSVPTFDGPPDCTPWVIGGLWPAELATVTPETAIVAAHLKSDLQRIAYSANERLRALRPADLPDSVRRAEEVRIIDMARAYAVQRVEAAIRQLSSTAVEFHTDPAIPAATPHGREEEPQPVPAAIEPEPDDQRLERLLEFVARQEPGLRWAVGDRDDGTTLLVTDLAHGWIPPGVALPAGIELLAPARRGGRVSELLGDVVRSAVYHPGDPFGARREETTVAATNARELRRVDDLGWKLAEVTHRRDGLSRMVHALARAGAAHTGVVDAEVDVLRVHCDTARYQLMVQYPDVDSALLSNCLLLAATEAIAAGDEMLANYHFAWFEALSAPPPSQWGVTP
jgi:hypothetical protein